ncbi:Signal recognition particle GTPase [Alteracholeplasma palmae J233]|uniref:Signal recognition particle receptor FtsY n=1 Tax=Alteracholeplasma palmae (strain ATCC 49389 / J233) TaxID=1318466 RepID=U4KKG2_ALTPJ|nr:signal recognition particle-docking protein FtsY [Alteracholeplasma palmae]CCV64053.1 Signal recognition particle GTPase [Alteracholeplasma palmae J233]
MGFFSKLFKKKPKNEKYELGLHKSRESFDNLKKLLEESPKIDEDLYEALEDLFIQADIGVETVIYFVNEIRKEVDLKNITQPMDLSELIVDKMFELYLKGEFVDTTLKYDENELNVYLFVGVNGVGKTTSIGKLAKQFKNQGKKVMLVAGDTFRAGAIDQLIEWGKRSDTYVYYKEAMSDPSSVIFDALKIAQDEKYDIVLCDTAGRLQNKANLMNELAKMKRVIERVLPTGLKETLLVIDATTGQNGMNQAAVFNEITEVTGIVLTKLDGTAKGGIVLAIRHLYGLPIKYVGLGEKIDDLISFDIEEYIYGLFKGFF